MGGENGGVNGELMYGGEKCGRVTPRDCWWREWWSEGEVNVRKGDLRDSNAT